MTISNDDVSGESILPAAAPTESLLAAYASAEAAIHHPKAGLNPLADAASSLFTAIGGLKQIQSCQQWKDLQQELIKTVTTFQETITQLGYQPEYVIVCRYVMCATIDDIINNTNWGNAGQWEPYALIPTLNQENTREDKFFTILERAIQEPAHYIDLMELMYLCLSMGYKGQYRVTDQNQYELEHITHALYKHIRAYRGGFSKTLSPTPLKMTRPNAKQAIDNGLSTGLILLISLCVIMVLFITLGYLTETLSNEAFKNIAALQPILTHETPA
jgi:type VI secretion system protein ImpK